MFCATILLIWTVRVPKPRGKEIFRTHPEAPSPIQPAVQWVPGLFIVAKADRAGVDDLLLSSVEITERVQDHFIGC